MEFILMSIIFILIGLSVMWLSIFGSNVKIKESSSGTPTDVSDFFLMMIYKLFPPIIRRIFLFLLGLGIVIGFIYLLFLKS
ncbi:hypothetical protein B6A27_12105 [Anoxybacillus sp. UARK-01]|nr:hypothetical protein B6A27_12105 [Anoxybacillus sp. UARK-01]